MKETSVALELIKLTDPLDQSVIWYIGSIISVKNLVIINKVYREWILECLIMMIV
jgi:hypothetical protein